MSDETISVREVADRLGISLKTAYAACHRDEIPCLRIGKRIVIPRARFEAWFAGRSE